MRYRPDTMIAPPPPPPIANRLTQADLHDARRRLLDMHFHARAGHLGGNLSCIDALMVAHHEFLGADDRFVLSKGHSAGALYVTLASLGHIAHEELASFHQDNTRLGGHPPPHGIAHIKFATGSLGHGLSLAAGLALAARLQNNPRRIICLTSDGEWQEGSTWEAAIFAAHQRLHNLTILVDHNGLQGFGTTHDVASMNPLADKLRGFDIEFRNADGHSLDSLRTALAPGTDRPVLASLRTTKGHGVPGLAGTLQSHYLPLTPAQHAAAIAELGMLP